MRDWQFHAGVLKHNASGIEYSYMALACNSQAAQNPIKVLDESGQKVQRERHCFIALSGSASMQIAL